MDGWAVLAALKDDIRIRHIPVHVISVEDAASESLRKGAIAHATKPLNQEELEQVFEKIEQTDAGKIKRVLLVEDDDRMRHSIKKLIGNRDVKVDEAATGGQAMEALRSKRYGCLVLDLHLPDMHGGDLLKRMEEEGMELPPVIIHTAQDLTEKEEMDLRERAKSIVIKDVRSQERLLDEVSLFLHRTVSDMPERKKQMIRNLHQTDVLLMNKKVLVVDDDMRTTFALSRLFSERGMKTFKASDGEQALQVLDQEPDTDIVLMDVMMPVMDGYETMKRIRAQERFRKLPIIALTAKAMPEDRKKCIEAGANDYLPKPVDQKRLVSLMRVWLYR
jgi:CheY-like chemotaxis protein